MYIDTCLCVCMYGARKQNSDNVVRDVPNFYPLLNGLGTQPYFYSVFLTVAINLIQNQMFSFQAVLLRRICIGACIYRKNRLFLRIGSGGFLELNVIRSEKRESV